MKAEGLESDTAVTPVIECEAGQFDEILAAAVEALPPPTPPVVEHSSADPAGEVGDAVPPPSSYVEVPETKPVPSDPPEEPPAGRTGPADLGAARAARPARVTGELTANLNRPFDKSARKRKPPPAHRGEAPYRFESAVSPGR